MFIILKDSYYIASQHLFFSTLNPLINYIAYHKWKHKKYSYSNVIQNYSKPKIAVKSNKV